MKPTLVILAAGIGSRYGGLKQIDTVGPSGETIIDYSIFDAIRAGFGKVVFVIRENIEQEFKAHFLGKLQHKIEIDFALQEINRVPKGISYPGERVKPWGTGHAVLVTADKVHEPFAVINADDFYGASAFQLLADYLSQLHREADTHCMVGYQLNNTLSDFGYVSRGVCEVDQEGNLTGVTERTHIECKDGKIVYTENGQEILLRGNETVSMNMLGFAPSIYPHVQQYFEDFIRKNNEQLKAEFYIPSVVNQVIKEGKGSLKVLNSSEKWFGITYKEDKTIAQQSIRKLIQKGIYPAKLW